MHLYTGSRCARFFALVVLAIAWAPSLSATGPVAECRAEHSRDSPEYVRCLEAALEATDRNSADQAGHTAAEPVPEPRPAGMGAEQVRDAEDAELSVRIVSTTYSSRGLGTFRLANGQVWRETTASPTRKHLDQGKPYTARIVRGRMGGYRMHVDGVRWMKTVERIE